MNAWSDDGQPERQSFVEASRSPAWLTILNWPSCYWGNLKTRNENDGVGEGKEAIKLYKKFTFSTL